MTLSNINMEVSLYGNFLMNCRSVYMEVSVELSINWNMINEKVY